MRIVVIDTETTGLNPNRGDRMVEIGAIVIENNEIQMDQTFHRFIDPQRDIPPEVVRIHGIDALKLESESALPFAETGREFLEFIAGSTLLFHNAPFDLGFIKKELANAGLPGIDDMPVLDSLLMARKRFPHQPNNLDALCDRFSIDRSHRQLHGALLDATLTARVFLKLVNKETVTAPAQGHYASMLPEHNMQDLMIDLYKKLEHRYSNVTQRELITGQPKLITELTRGEMVVIADQSSANKTIVAAKIISNLSSSDLNPCAIAIFYLHHPAIKWAEYALATEAKIDLKTMQSGKFSPKIWRKFATASGALVESNIHVYDTSPVSVQQIGDTCQKLRDESDRTIVIVIDDLQGISTSEHAEDKDLELDTIIRALKTLAKALDVAILLLTQRPIQNEPYFEIFSDRKQGEIRLQLVKNDSDKIHQDSAKSWLFEGHSEI